MKAETKMSSQRKTNPVQYCLYVEPKKYSKLVNVVKRSRFTHTESTLGINSEEREARGAR